MIVLLFIDLQQNPVGWILLYLFSIYVYAKQ